jgi:Reverse transcriptase (RNA-dependent DNA polymerase)
LNLRQTSVVQALASGLQVFSSPFYLLIRERPNSLASFSTSLSNEPLPPWAANVLQAPGISKLLQAYPNRRFVDTLTSIALTGARVGFQGNPAGVIRRPNHSPAFHHPDVVHKSIHDEIQKGWVAEIAKSDLPSQGYFCSPIGLVPKTIDGVQTGWRVIFDLSSPQGLSVNDGIPKEFGTLVYETLNDAIQLVAQVGRGAVMMKRDLKAAFRHIPINPCDYWLLVFEWDGKYYVDMFLPFGLRTAPRIFNLFAEALHWVFETLYEWNCTHYLDDFLFVFPPHTDSSAVSAQFDEVLNEFGFSKAPEKDLTGCVVVHLGFEFDSNLMQVRLPPNKKQRALDAILNLLSSSTVTLSALESTLGFLSHCCQVVPLGRPFLRNMFSQICRNPTHPQRRIRLDSSSRQDLRWWLQFLRS